MKKKIVALFLFSVLFLLSVFLRIYALSETYSVNEYYYAQLSSEEKIIYSAFEEAVTAGQQEFEIIGFPQSITHFVLHKKGLSSGAEIKDVVSQSSELSAITQTINAFLQTAMDAFLLDHPEYFWLDGGSCSIAMSFSTKAYSALEGKIDVSIFFIGGWAVKSGYDSYEKEYAQMIQKIKGIGAGADRFNTLKKIHDFLCSTVVYEKTAPRHGDAAGALIDGKAVCQGYAHAFKIACDFYNIPCICVSGTGVGNSGTEAHMWNYVQMENGLWYAVDSTWDDGGQKIYYDYFLSGDSTVDTYFGKHKFADTHVADGRQTTNSVKVFTYPALAVNAYEYQGGNLSAAETPEITAENGTTAAPTENIVDIQTPQKTEKGVLDVFEKENDTPIGILREEEENVLPSTQLEEQAVSGTENAEKDHSSNYLWIVFGIIFAGALAAAITGIFLVKRRRHLTDQKAEE